MDKFFHIESIDKDSLFVIILSSEMTSVYWSDLLTTFRENHWNNKTVYFDFLFRNGCDNRFFSAVLDERSNFSGRLKRCEVLEPFDVISRRFFRKNVGLLSYSILSSQQIKSFLEGYKI